MKKLRSAFTIIELLVAVAVTAMLVALILNITVNVLNVWNRSTGILTSSNQARVVLDQLSQDFQSVVWRRDIPNAKWIVANIQADTALSGMTNESWAGTTKPALGASLDLAPAYTAGQTFTDAKYGQKGLWLRMLTHVSGSNSGLSTLSAPRAVAYQLVRRAQSANADAVPVYQMFRSEVGVTETFNAGYDLTDTTTYPHVGALTSDDLPLVLRKPSATQLISNDVVDFGIRFYNSAGGVIFPANAAHRNFAAAVTAAGYDVVEFPASAEVYIRVLTAEGVRRVEAYEAGNLNASLDWWNDIVLPNSTVYSRRVALRASPL